MSIGVASRKALWGRSGNACAMQECRRDLMPRTDEATGGELAGAGILIGEEAHIRSSSPDGPRHDPAYGDFDSYENLILLCPTHHTLVDKSGGADWPVERLEQIKADHEAWVRSRLSLEETDLLKLQVLVAGGAQYIDERLFDRWPTAYWQLSRAIPALGKQHFQALIDVGVFLLKRDWPANFPSIVTAAERLRVIVAILCEYVNDAMRSEGEDTPLQLFRAEKQLSKWDPPLHDRLFHATQINMVAGWWLADSLTLELNNWILAVRSDVDSTYRFAEGVILALDGDAIVSPIRYVRLQHPADTGLPTLPTSLSELRGEIERVAAEREVEPQDLEQSEIKF